jgi:hypothetical protein
LHQPERYNQDTSYYGQGRGSPEERRYAPDDIPLQDHPGAKTHAAHGVAPDAGDHVYDRTEGGGASRSKKKGHVRLGQLGMFGSDRKRIPWVVYLFSVIQIAVFIGEIVRNGKCRFARRGNHSAFNI